MILVYSEHKTNRLQYTLDVLFKHVLQVSYTLVSFDEFTQKSAHPKLNYSTKNIKNCVQIVPHTLLFETDVYQQSITVKWKNDIPYFFTTSDEKDTFDILASTFFMVSRYEEYLPSTLDKHKRFTAENTLAFKNNFLKKPVVNLWALELKKKIKTLFPDFQFPKQQFKHSSTFDIDIAYAYKGKKVFRQLGSAIKSLLTFNLEGLKNRVHYYFFAKKDPFAVYDVVDALHKKYQTENVFFFLLGNKGEFDNNLNYLSKPLHDLIKKTANHMDVGIHPSYQSNFKDTLVATEINRLANITKKTVTKSRQHFLKLSFPKTYQNLVSNNIKEEYSMGFASQIGFRAGICTSYPFFNLTENKKEDLLIFPFQIMDGTLNEYLQLSPKEAISEIENIVLEIKKVNGLFISLWHNSSLSETTHWKNWSVVFEKLLEICARNKSSF